MILLRKTYFHSIIWLNGRKVNILLNPESIRSFFQTKSSFFHKYNFNPLFIDVTEMKYAALMQSKALANIQHQAQTFSTSYAPKEFLCEILIFNYFSIELRKTWCNSIQNSKHWILCGWTSWIINLKNWYWSFVCLHILIFVR